VSLRLAAVYAHPDDDTHGNGGILAMEGDNVEYTLVVATSGGAGVIADPSLATPDNLTTVREGEEIRSLEILGVRQPNVHFLGYPDGELQDVPRDELVARIVQILLPVRPHVVLTFGPEGVTRHSDHIAAGEAATEAFHRLRLSSGEGSGDAYRRLLHSALPKLRWDALWRALRERGIDVGDPDGPFVPRGVPDDSIAFEVDCAGVLDRKMEALHAHRTQASEVDVVPEDLRGTAFGTEYFVQAWPERQAGGERLHDIFDGLDPT